MKDQLNLRVFTTDRSIWRRQMAKWSLFKYHPIQRVCMDWVDRQQNYKDLYGILQLLLGSHLDNFPLKTLKLCWVAFHSLTFQLKCLDFLSNQCKKLAPELLSFLQWAIDSLYLLCSIPLQIGLCPIPPHLQGSRYFTVEEN